MTQTDDISLRIKALVDYFSGGNNSKFAALTGTSEANIRNYISGRQPKFDFISSIVRALEISYEWLLTGEGSMLREEQKNKIAEVSSILSTISIPLVDISVAAGNGGCNNSSYLDVIDHIQLPSTLVKKNAKYLCIRVKGESMAPTLLDSSYVIIRMLNCPEWEDMPDQHIYVVSDKEGKAYIKRLKNRISQHGFVVCTSDNPDKYCYPNFNLQVNEINTIWHAEWYLSAKMPNIHETYYNKICKLEDDMDLIKNQFSQLIKKISK